MSDAAEAPRRKARPRVILLAVLGTLAAAYLAIVLVVYVAQDRMVFLPSAKLLGAPADVGMAFEDVNLAASDGVRLHGWWVPATGPSRGAAIFFHGNGGNISYCFETIAILREGLKLDVLIFDYRGYGRSGGKPGEPGVYRDARAAWDFLADEKKVPPEKIVLWGRSLGTAVASQLAGEVRPAALVLESAHRSVPAMGAEVYPWLPVRLLCRLRLDNVAHLARVRCPVLVIHSPDDEMVGIGHGRTVFAAAPEPKEFLEITGSHNEGFLTSGGLYLDGAERFLAKYLPR